VPHDATSHFSRQIFTGRVCAGKKASSGEVLDDAAAGIQPGFTGCLLANRHNVDRGKAGFDIAAAAEEAA